MVMHAKTFYSLIILDNWIETLLFKLLPISTEFIFVVRVEE